MQTGHIQALDELNFAHEVLHQSDTPVLVSVTGTWAREGETLAPIVAQIARDFADQIKVGCINFDASYPLAGIYGVRSAPAVLVFQAGRKVRQHLGLCTRERLLELLGVEETPPSSQPPTVPAPAWPVPRDAPSAPPHSAPPQSARHAPSSGRHPIC